MHSFALAVAKPGRAIPPHVLETLDEASPFELPFAAESHIRWSDDRGRTVFGGWQTAADHLGVGSHWEVRPSGLTAFTGHLWRQGEAWASGATWAAQLADKFDRVSLVSSLEDYQGVYTAVSIAADGSGCIASDPLAFAPLYWGESDDVVVVSTRSALTARLITSAGQRATRVADGVASLAYCTYVIGNRTGFAGVETIPPGSYLALGASGSAAAEVRVWSARPWLPVGDEDVDDLDALVRGLREEFAESVRAIAQVSARERIADLTGGRDSRFVLSLLLSEGLADRFVFNTFGSPGLPDTIVATAIADHFDLAHRATSRAKPPAPTPGGPSGSDRPAARPATFEERIRHHVFMTSGLLSVWDLRGWSRHRSPDMVVTGLFAEALRTIYPAKADIATMDALVRQVPGKGFGFDPAGIFTAETRARFDAEMMARLVEMHPEGGTPQDALDGFYLSGRLRRWFGPQPDTETTNRVFPLYSLRAIRAAYALGSRARLDEILAFELQRATHEELATMPFASSSWPEAAISHLPDADRFRTLPATPKVGGVKPPTQTVNRENQDRQADERLPILRAQLDLGKNHPLFDVFDRRALFRAFDRFDQLSVRGRRAIHSAATAAIWLERTEAPYARER